MYRQHLCEHCETSAFEIIVVDNASPQGGVETLPESFPTSRSSRVPENVGFAKANNIGFAQSTGSLCAFSKSGYEAARADYEHSAPSYEVVAGRRDRRMQNAEYESNSPDQLHSEVPYDSEPGAQRGVSSIALAELPSLVHRPPVFQQDGSGQSGSDTRSVHAAPA